MPRVSLHLRDCIRCNILFCLFQVDDPTKLVNGDYPEPLNATACILKDADDLNEEVSILSKFVGQI